MGLNFAYLSILLSAIVVILWAGFLVTRATLGPQTARRSLYYSGAWLLFGAVISMLLAFAGRYGLLVLYGIYAVSVYAWLLSWPVRKQKTGALKLEVGRTSQNKLLFWVGLVLSGVAIAMTFSLLDKMSGPLSTTSSLLAGLVETAFWWAPAVLFLLLGLSDLEIRENGLSYLYAWQPWDRVEAFGWDDDKPNTLLLRVVPRTPLSRRYVSLTIPSHQKEAVDQLIDDYISEADLAAEMDGEVVA
ncbi:MAG: hypothetical protein AAF703_08335 [Cyanobacteria bacterium P01_D01_bin.105]